MNARFKLGFSGGGFRATFYCLGAYRRLVELGLHREVSDLSSVSGGSIAAGAIMIALRNGDFLNVSDFDNRVTQPLRDLGQVNFRRKLMMAGISPRLSNLRLELPRTRYSRLFPELLDKYLFKGVKLAEIPKIPEWSCNATCLNTMKRFRFKAVDIYGYKLGTCIEVGEIPLSVAVAASAAFPLMFAPIAFSTHGMQFVDKYRSASYTSSPPPILYLTDGGVYDNIGSENLLKGDGVFISIDASAEASSWKATYQPNYFNKWRRVLSVSLDQVVSLRRRLLYKENNGIQLVLSTPLSRLIESEKEHRQSNLPLYPTNVVEVERLISGLRTDLDAFHDIEIDTLMWSGAVRMDIAIKSLFPTLFNEQSRQQIPKFPHYPLELMREVLEKGQNMRKLGKLHKSVHLRPLVGKALG